jgi:hypothetical protein
MVPLRLLIDVEKNPIIEKWEDNNKRLQPDALANFSGVGTLEGGTDSGQPAVIVRIDMPDGSIVLAQTTLRLFQMAARAFTAKYGDLTQSDLTPPWQNNEERPGWL